MKYVFGPVTSRRLGKSLGIDPVPLKTCNWNCVYCQLGRTRPLTNVRREYVPCQEIIAEVQQVLAVHQAGAIDWVTFVGSGEPTLHSRLGWLIRQVKDMTTLPVAVITNGALLYLLEVRQQLTAADAVLPTLDAGSPRLYRKINRPWPVPTFERMIDGFVSFRKEFMGKLWVEVMLVNGLNDTQEALMDIATVVQSIQPDRVHINLPMRPPAEAWVQPPDREGVLRAIAILGENAGVVPPAQGRFDFSGHESINEAIVAILTRHPMHEEELIAALEDWAPGEAHRILDRLRAGGQVQVVERSGKRFWSVAAARYADSLSPFERRGA